MAVHSVVAAGYTNGSVAEFTNFRGFGLEKHSSPRDEFSGIGGGYTDAQFNTAADSRAENIIEVAGNFDGGVVWVRFNMTAGTPSAAHHAVQLETSGAWALGRIDDGGGLTATYSTGSGAVVPNNTDCVIKVDASNTATVDVYINGVKVINAAALSDTYTGLYAGLLVNWSSEFTAFQIGTAGGGAATSLVTARRRQLFQRGLITHPRRFR